jgi:hypothetical protein
MSLLDPWRQARAEIIASRPTYTPFYTPGNYAVTVGNPDTGMVDQVAWTTVALMMHQSQACVR